ncbi:MAG: CHAT domain-containing protein, partial [Acidobacteriota bacterium]
LAATYLRAGAPDVALSHAFRAEMLARRHLDRTGSEPPADRAIEYEEVRRQAIAVALSVLASERSAPGEEPPATSSEEHEEESTAAPVNVNEEEQTAPPPEVEPEPAPGEKAAGSPEEKSEEGGENSEEGDEPAASMKPASVRQVWDEVIRSRTVAFDRLAGDAASASAQSRGTAIGLTQVSAALPAESSLLAFVRYERVSNRPPEEGTAPGPRLSYIAFTLTAGSTEPEAIPLGEADRIDPLIGRVRELAAMIPGERPGIDEVAGRTYVDAAGELRGAIWDPVAPLLAGSRRIFIVPDGAISLVSFAALPIEAERYLVETGPLLHYLSAERDLVRPSRRDGGTRGLLAVGGPDFDAEIKSAPGGEGSRASCADLRSMTFEALPGSRDEAKAIADIWKKAPREETSDRRDAPPITILTDRRATEEALRTLAPQHAVLHLATRSFFAPGTCRSILDAAAPVGLVPTDAGPAADDAATIAGEEDPMLEEATAVADLPLVLSGLVLAGANHASIGEAPEDGGDGILTAGEIASLDLSNVDWAVLAATGSGLDGVASGARVDGLRRAFERAGAGTLIMSLWPIGDEASLAWLKALYEARLSGLETAEAMRAATVGLLEAHRKSDRSLLPIDWGAYVAAGDWR